VSNEYPLYTISDDGHASAIGMMAMQIIGFTNIKSLAGGLQAWQAWQATQPTPTPVPSTTEAPAGTEAPATTATPSPVP
jgi:3-mercaptopyruvate sulfurtransferase SseA